MADTRTPEEKLNEIMEKADFKIKKGKLLTDQFAKQLLENADYYFGWADRAMEAAATERVFHITLETAKMALEAKKDPAEIIADAQREALQQALRYAQHPERSTSTTSNAMSQFRGQAWAELYDYLKNF